MDFTEQLKSLFAEIPPKWDKIRNILENHDFRKEELTDIALKLTGSCYFEYQDYVHNDPERLLLDSMHSGYLTASLKLLLEYGLDPNNVVDDDNVMWKMQYIDTPYIGASALGLLLRHGGNPNLHMPDEPKTLFEFVADKLSDDFDSFYDITVQCWLVLMAFGGRHKSGRIPVTMLKGNSVEIFKEVEHFDFWIESIPGKYPGYPRCIMHIFNKETKEEVARYK